MNPKRSLLPQNQPRKPPVAPPVYRPQPNPVCVQRKPITSAQPGTTKSAPHIYRPSPPRTVAVKNQSAPQSKRNPKAPPVYKPAPSKFGPPKPATPKVFSPAASRRVAVQPKMGNGTALKPSLTKRLPRVPVHRPAAFIRPGAIQLRPIGRLEDWYLRPPSDEEQLHIHRRCAEKLAPHAHEEVGENFDGRINIASLFLAKAGGAETFETKMFGYFLGLRKNAPAAQFTGLGTLAFDGREITGRPGFLKSFFNEDEITGAPGRAFRHKTAWHNIRKLINAIMQHYGPGRIKDIVESIRGRLDKRIDDEANKMLKRAGSEEEHNVLWLATVLNSSRSNLWLGPAKENISINTAGYHLHRWTDELDAGELDLLEYRDKVFHAQFASEKAQYVKSAILRILDEAKGQADPLTYAINRIKHEAVSILEIDLRHEVERNDSPHHLQIYQIAHGVGDLAIHPRLIDGLLGLS